MTALSKIERKRLAVLQRQYVRLLETLPTDPRDFDPWDIDRIVLASEEMLALNDDMMAILGEADVEP